MDIAATVRESRWGLASASKYRERAGSGCFGAVPDIMSLHSFGWDRQALCLYVEDFFGIGATVTRRVSMPVELAEAFLMSCLNVDFRQTFLLDTFGATDKAEERLYAMGHSLTVVRGAVTRSSSGRPWLPGLSMVCTNPEGKSESLGLFCELRTSLGQRSASLSATKVRKSLGS